MRHTQVSMLCDMPGLVLQAKLHMSKAKIHFDAEHCDKPCLKAPRAPLKISSWGMCDSSCNYSTHA